MAYIEGHARDPALLLPASVEDYVSADNPVRFIDAFVDDLDLGEAGFHRSQPKATGRPGYDLGDMLKLYLYGYLNRVRSSRRLEAEAVRNLEVIWLLRGLRPDFKTIADFRRDNRSAFKAVFRAFVLLCRKLDLFGRELLAVDGTRLKAVNSRERNFTKAKLDKYIKSADERLETYLGQLDNADRGEEAGTTRRSEALAAKIAKVREQRQVNQAMLEQLKASGESQISLTDPDARAMAAHPKVGVGYNAQVAVDAKHKLITEQHVTNAGSDLGFLAETAGAAKDILGVERIDVVADMGYYMGEDIAACERAGITPYVAARSAARPSATGAFPRSDSATMKPRIATTAPPINGSIHGTAGFRAVISSCNIQTRAPVAVANSRRSAPGETSAASRGGKARPCLTAWQYASPPGPESWIFAARRSSTHSVRSSNG
jgi:transposase